MKARPPKNEGRAVVKVSTQPKESLEALLVRDLAAWNAAKAAIEKARRAG